MFIKTIKKGGAPSRSKSSSSDKRKLSNATKKIRSFVKQYKETKEIKSLLSQGAKVYKKSFKERRFKGFIIRNNVLSNKCFDNSTFEKAQFIKCRLNSVKLNNVLIQESKFINSELKKAYTSNSRFEKTFFENMNLENFICKDSFFINCNFKDCFLDNALFSNVDFTGSLFSNTKKHLLISYKKIPLFKNCKLDSITLINNCDLFIGIQFFISGAGNNIDDLKILNKKKYVLNELFLHENIVFNKLHMSNIIIRDLGIFKNCVFNKLKLYNYRF